MKEAPASQIRKEIYQRGCQEDVSSASGNRIFQPKSSTDRNESAAAFRAARCK
jgi:hypothetical protein